MVEKVIPEVWRNTTAGMRWFIVFDATGRERTRTVQGGRTFTISTLERQINQSRAASGAQDSFRNGTFVLVKASEDTDPIEIKGPDALTDLELEQLINDLSGDATLIDDILEEVTSPFALSRLYEEMVANGIDKKAVQKVKAARATKENTTPVEREVVSTAIKE